MLPNDALAELPLTLQGIMCNYQWENIPLILHLNFFQLTIMFSQSPAGSVSEIAGSLMQASLQLAELMLMTCFHWTVHCEMYPVYLNAFVN